MIVCKVNTHSLKSGAVQTACKMQKYTIYLHGREKSMSIKNKMIGSEKGIVLEKFGQYFVIVFCLFVSLFLLKWNFLEGLPVFLVLILTGIARVWKGAEQLFQAHVGQMAYAHLVLHRQAALGQKPQLLYFIPRVVLALDINRFKCCKGRAMNL